MLKDVNSTIDLSIYKQPIIKENLIDLLELCYKKKYNGNRVKFTWLIRPIKPTFDANATNDQLNQYARACMVIGRNSDQSN